jgi:hypothetical protein
MAARGRIGGRLGTVETSFRVPLGLAITRLGPRIDLNPLTPRRD